MRSRRYEDVRLRKVAKEAVGKTVLDIGYAQIPNPHLGAFHRVGFDLERPVSGTVRYEEEIQGDALQISRLLAGRRFDTIICGELVEHLENPYAFLRDLGGMLLPDGRLIVTTPNPLAFPVCLFELGRSRKYFYTSEHKYYFTPRWAVRLLEGAGFDVCAVRSVGWWLPFGALGLCPVPLSYQVIYVARWSGCV